ncbi:MAG TPA: hypothetical protein VD884_06530 [Ohtaekwangia sp.]|nr:hypothetical protein [Ohtaekwangia sp.]
MKKQPSLDIFGPADIKLINRMGINDVNKMMHNVKKPPFISGFLLLL